MRIIFLIFVISFLYISCASYRACSIFWDNCYYGKEFNYYGGKREIFKGYFVQDSEEEEGKRVLQLKNVLSEREHKGFLLYIPKKPKKEKYVGDCEDLFNRRYLNYDSILPTFSIKNLIKHHKMINKIKMIEGKSRKELEDSAVALVIPEFSYPYKEELLRSLGQYKNYPVYFFDDYKRGRCYILFPVLDTNESVSYYIGKLSNVDIDYVIRSKKMFVVSCLLVPLAFTFDIITSPIQIYLMINFPDEFFGMMEGYKVL
jgi:hypothetical protein